MSFRDLPSSIDLISSSILISVIELTTSEESPYTCKFCTPLSQAMWRRTFKARSSASLLDPWQTRPEKEISFIQEVQDSPYSLWAFLCLTGNIKKYQVRDLSIIRSPTTHEVGMVSPLCKTCKDPKIQTTVWKEGIEPFFIMASFLIFYYLILEELHFSWGEYSSVTVQRQG